MIATDHNTFSDGNLETLLLGLLFTALVALFVVLGCRGAGKPDWAATGGGVVVVVGAILTLLAVF